MGERPNLGPETAAWALDSKAEGVFESGLESAGECKSRMESWVEGGF